MYLLFLFVFFDYLLIVCNNSHGGDVMKISEYLDTKLLSRTNDCKFVDPFGNEIEKTKLKIQYDQFEVVEVKYELIAIIKVK